MNKIFVDTDVILDLLARRLPHFHFSAVLFTFAEMKKLELYTSPLIFANTFYILRKQLGNEEAKKALRKVKNGVKYEKRPVLMFTMDGDFVREFSSIVDASKITGAPKDSISRCCKHERYKSAGGYKWEYK